MTQVKPIIDDFVKATMRLGCIILILLMGRVVISQNLNISTPTLSTRIQGIPVSDLFYKSNYGKLDSLTGKFGMKTILFMARIPVLYKIKEKENLPLPRITYVGIVPVFGYRNMTLTWLTNKQNVITGGLGIEGLYFDGNKNLFIGSYQTFMANDNYTLFNPNIRHTGYVYYNRLFSSKFSMNGMLLYSYTFGRGLLLPAVGFKIAAGKKASLSVNIPLGIQYTNKHNSKYIYSVSLRPRGTVSTITNQFGEFNTPATEVILRQSEYRLYYTGRIIRSNHIFAFDAGISMGRTLFISETASRGIPINFAAADIKTTPYLQLTYTYQFGSRKEKGDKLYLNDIEIEDLIY